VSTVRLLPLAAPVAAGVAVTTSGAATILAIIGALTTLLLARTINHRLRGADPTDTRTGS
jgi:hypothetical protein